MHKIIYFSIFSPPVAPKRRLEERNCSDTGIPQIVKCEIAQLVNKFTITHNNDGNEECKRMTLICSISKYNFTSYSHIHRIYYS